MKFGEIKAVQEEIYGGKMPIRIIRINVDNTIILKLAETKNNSKYLIGYLDDVIRPLVLVLPKLSGYLKTFNGRDKNNKLISLRVDDDMLFEKYKTIWIKIEDFKNIELDALPAYDDRYLKTKKNMWWQIL